jgi:hypothetical protein
MLPLVRSQPLDQPARAPRPSSRARLRKWRNIEPKLPERQFRDIFATAINRYRSAVKRSGIDRLPRSDANETRCGNRASQFAVMRQQRKMVSYERDCPATRLLLLQINVSYALKRNKLAPDSNAHATLLSDWRRCTMDAGHGCSTKVFVGDCFKRSPGCLVGVILPLCIDGRLQSDNSVNPLSRPIFVALLKLLPFDGVSRFKGIDLGFVEPSEKLRAKNDKRNKDSRNGSPLCCFSGICFRSSTSDRRNRWWAKTPSTKDR